jgi:hypothetical protein
LDAHGFSVLTSVRGPEYYLGAMSWIDPESDMPGRRAARIPKSERN